LSLTLALSGRPQRLQARGRRRMRSALAARRTGACHGPLERVVRCPPFPGTPPTAISTHCGHSSKVTSQWTQFPKGLQPTACSNQRRPQTGQAIVRTDNHADPSIDAAPTQNRTSAGMGYWYASRTGDATAQISPPKNALALK